MKPNTPHVEKHLRASTDFAPDVVADAADDLQVVLEAALVDQVVRRAKVHARLLDGDGKQGAPSQQLRTRLAKTLHRGPRSASEGNVCEPRIASLGEFSGG